MKTLQTAQIIIKSYAAIWFSVGAYYAAMILKSTVGSTAVDSGFGYGFALAPLLLSGIALWLGLTKDPTAQRIIIIVLGLISTMFVLSKPILAVTSLALMIAALLATKTSPGTNGQ
jgi:hypothetical protein